MTEPIDFLRAIPKVQLHCHLEGTLKAASFIDLARKHGVALTYESHNGAWEERAEDRTAVDESGYHFTDFRAFLLTFAAVSRSLAEPDDYHRLAAEYVEEALSAGVRHAELFISPSVWQFFHPELDIRACVKAIGAAFEPVKDRLTVGLIADLTRNFGAEAAMRTAALAEGLMDVGVIGVGLGGDEARFPAELFEAPFAWARAAGLHTVAHAGEAAGAQSVRAAVEVLGAERIGHGVRALEDPAVVSMLAERAIPLEVCPTSNFLTGAAERGKAHPLLSLDEAGCIITIDADDPPMFGTTLLQEYAYVEGLAGRESLLRYARNAVDAGFASPQRKAELHQAFRDAGLEPEPARRI